MVRLVDIILSVLAGSQGIRNVALHSGQIVRRDQKSSDHLHSILSRPGHVTLS